MHRRLMSIAGAGMACVPLLLSGCGEMSGSKLWPFGSDTVQERSRTPANATEYRCAAGKRFYVRTLEGGAAVWLILPEREVRLERLGPDTATRYGKGTAVLEINGSDASLKDGATVLFTGCNTGSSETK